MSLNYSIDAVGKIKRIEAQINSTYSPEKLRKSLAKICDVSEDKFQKTDARTITIKM